MKLPYIFIFDIDGTIIGEIHHQILEWELLKIIEPSLIKNFDISEYLNNGMLRPNFKDFIEFINKKYKNVEIFVYTNSSYGWAKYGIIPNIQKNINNKINEPYFTRDDSNNMQKLLGNLYDNIIETLIPKYPLLKLEKNKDFVFQNQIVFIDDIKENLKDYPQKQILCPEYTYADCYDMKSRIIDKYHIKEDKFDNEKVLNFFEESKLPIYNIKGSILQQDKYFQQLLELRLQRRSEILNFNDTFFKRLITILDEEKTLKLDDKTIIRINKKLNNIE
jgi:hypothetical protein